MVANRESEITSGKPDEKPLAFWKYDGMSVTVLPDDEQKIIRISVGGCDAPLPMHYCTIRGEVGRCIELLEKAVAALRAAP